MRTTRQRPQVGNTVKVIGASPYGSTGTVTRIFPHEIGRPDYEVEIAQGVWAGQRLGFWPGELEVI